MSAAPLIRLLPDGQRLHLQHGPIDLVIGATGTPPAIVDAYQAAGNRFATVLDELCDELALLRAPASPGPCPVTGPVARRMWAAVAPFAPEVFITPMAAVAGAVADEMVAAMAVVPRLARAYVNNGGDIALHLMPGERFRVGMVDRPDQPSLFGEVGVEAADPVRGIATSGWRGRSFSLGVADAVTVLARSAAAADAAATVVANRIDLPDHPGIRRAPASTVRADSDLGDRLVTRHVPVLDSDAVAQALAGGMEAGSDLLDRGLVAGAALHLQGRTAVLGTVPGLAAPAIPFSVPAVEHPAHA